VSVTAPRGFLASGVAAGLKASGRLDLGLLVSERTAVAGGLFTTNAFPAAPVILSKRRLLGSAAHAVVANSGQANAGTGPDGLDDAEAVADAAATALAIDPVEVLACSTGVIGPRIPLGDAVDGAWRAAASLDNSGGHDFAESILTTDTVVKEAVVEGDGFVVGGCAKGAGMIAPDLATLLVFLTTDAETEPTALRRALRFGAGPVWNSVTVDNCPSTNDTVLLLANGASGVTAAPEALTEAVAESCRLLALQVMQDAEGATTTLVVQVDGASTTGDARAAGKAIAGSMLVKTALFGRDPNPGRILQALGASGARIVPEQVNAALTGVPVIEAGRIPPSFDPEACAEAMKEREVLIRVSLGSGPGSATAFGCDLGYEYVRINGEYTT
jgi:glutamate N-acetyltransferase/amino-acid N-acetyltransferase